MSRARQVLALFTADYQAHYAYKRESQARSLIRLLPRTVANPSLHAVLLIRLITLGPSWLKPLWRNILLAKHSSDVSDQMRIGPGLSLPHPWGIVLGRVVLGPNCVIYHNVTMGVRAPHLVTLSSTKPEGVPTLGDGVTVYCGSVILGPISIGDRAVIGANVLLGRDVPPETTVGFDQALSERQFLRNSNS